MQAWGKYLQQAHCGECHYLQYKTALHINTENLSSSGEKQAGDMNKEFPGEKCNVAKYLVKNDGPHLNTHRNEELLRVSEAGPSSTTPYKGGPSVFPHDGNVNGTESMAPMLAQLLQVPWVWVRSLWNVVLLT